MNEDLSRKRLGRGLAALIGDIERPADVQRRPAVPDGKAPIEQLTPNPRNPRRAFAVEELADLAQSIREHGIVQPIVVRPRPGGYEIIAGERRWRAAQQAGIADVPILIKEVDDRVALEIAIIENVQRADLNPLEEAGGYQQLIDEYQYSQSDLAQVIGKSRSHVANTLRLLKLPQPIQVLLNEGALSAGHARTLVTAADPEYLARRIVDEGLSVRQAEAMAQERAREKPAKSPPREKDADTLALQKLLSDVTGLAVSINHRETGGDVRIAYATLEQLDELCRRLQRQ